MPKSERIEVGPNQELRELLAEFDGLRTELEHANEEIEGLRVRLQAAEAENVRHRNANLVRAVLEGYDGAVSDIINDENFDKVPWIVAESLRVRLQAAEAAAKSLAEALAESLQFDSETIRENAADALAEWAAAAASGTATGPLDALAHPNPNYPDGYADDVR